jgi:soluble lytic murein transglycosylase
MKQESGFDAQAMSKAGARGLMQMMPATGTTQAKREGLRNFNADALFDPETNARLGTAYLRDVQRRYSGNLYLTLAHYNAGPEALADWIPLMANRPQDEAVEDIGYSETRDYVKRVLANYWTYQALYD